MKIVHRVCISAAHNVKLKKKLQKLGIHMKDSGNKQRALLSYFDISEDDPLWPKVDQILQSAGIKSRTTSTVFSNDEIVSAEWVRVFPEFMRGYPMPDLDGSWIKLSFNASEECQICGIGIGQIAPIHLKSEPRMGRNDFMGIFWTYDIFARNEVFEGLSQNSITGFEAYPVTHYETKMPLTTIRQLKILGELAPGIVSDNLTRESYACEHDKYLGLSRGMYRFSRNIFKDMPDLVKTHEWFGSGHEAIQLVLASANFAKLYMERGWRGLSLAPIHLV